MWLHVGSRVSMCVLLLFLRISVWLGTDITKAIKVWQLYGSFQICLIISLNETLRAWRSWALSLHNAQPYNKRQ